MMNNIKTALACLTIAAALPLSGCVSKKTGSDSGKLHVYASFYAMQDFASQIGGDKVDIYTLCPAGTEPHDYEPASSEMAELTESDVLIMSGMGMEPWRDSVISVLDGTDVITVTASDNAPNIAEDYDPHIWLDPDNAYAEMKAIADAFIKADPDNKDYYKGRLSDCEKKLETLKNDYKEALSDISKSTIITSHQAYFSMCNAFGLTQLAINGIDNNEDPAPAHMSEIEDFIRDNDIRYIFSEPLGDDSVISAIAADTGCAVLVLDPFEGSGQNKDYFTVMYENLDALTIALK